MNCKNIREKKDIRSTASCQIAIDYFPLTTCHIYNYLFCAFYSEQLRVEILVLACLKLKRNKTWLYNIMCILLVIIKGFDDRNHHVVDYFPVTACRYYDGCIPYGLGCVASMRL